MTRLAILIAIALAGCSPRKDELTFGVPITFTNHLSNVSQPPTYTVDAGGVWQHTNCVFVGECPQGDGTCTLIRYVDNGVTNEFHAWMVPVMVVTNR